MDKFKKRLFIVGAILVLAVALPLTVYLVQQQQNLRQGAAPNKFLALKPGTQNAKVGDNFKINVVLHPNGDSVKDVKIVINYDSTKVAADDFTVNPAFTLDIKNKVIDNGQIVLRLNTDQLSKFVSKQAIVGTLSFHVLEGSSDSDGTDISFGDINTVVKGADGKQVKYDFQNAHVVIGEGNICPVDHSTCSWDSVDGVDTYNFIVTDITTNTIVTQGNIHGSSTSFTSIPGHTYTCTVTATNECGNSTPGSDTKTCISLTPTPTLSITPSETLTPTETPTSTPTSTPTETPTSTPTSTPTNTPTPTVTPTGTLTPTVTLTPTITNTPTPTITRVPGISATNTPIPTLPPTGSSAVTFGAILGAGLVVLGGILLLLF